jgi:hypothetical protein
MTIRQYQLWLTIVVCVCNPSYSGSRIGGLWFMASLNKVSVRFLSEEIKVLRHRGMAQAVEFLCKALSPWVQPPVQQKTFSYDSHYMGKLCFGQKSNGVLSQASLTDAV